jgi:hypothetical protein
MHEEQPALDGGVRHSVRVRDLRARFGEAEAFAAECSCGWSGERREGLTAAREARRDGRTHSDSMRDAS